MQVLFHMYPYALEHFRKLSMFTVEDVNGGGSNSSAQGDYVIVLVFSSKREAEEECSK